MADSEYAADRFSVDHDKFDSALVVTIWGEGVDVASRIRIPVEEVPSFLQQVTQHGLYALMQAARRIEVGNCETCGNTGLVEGPAPGGRTQTVHCPECRDRWPDKPFASAPHIGPRRKDS